MYIFENFFHNIYCKNDERRGVIYKMLRGVNKRIIEISNIEGGYFEKVLFFVNDDRKEPDSVFENQAQKHVSDSCALKFRRKIFTSDTLKFILKMSAAAGAGLAAGIFLL